MTPDGLVDTSSLKELAIRKLKPGSVLRELLLAEKDYLTKQEYYVKLDTWLKLLKLEG